MVPGGGHPRGHYRPKDIPDGAEADGAAVPRGWDRDSPPVGRACEVHGLRQHHEQDLQRQKGPKQVYYLRCKLYADSGEEKLCTRHSIRLDRLIDLVLERLRHYVQNYYTLEEMELPQPRDTKRDVLLQEQKALTAQLEKRSAALKNLYLDKVSGVLSEGQFVDLNQDFLAEKSRLERRLSQIDEELAEQEQPRQQTDLMEKAQELLKLDTLPRELAVMLIQKIEIGEQDPDTGQQEVKIHWKF